MATKKTSTRGKTKTAKTTVKKSTKAAKTITRSATSKNVTTNSLRKIQIVSLISSILLIIAAALFMSGASRPMTWPHLTTDALNKAQIAPAESTLYNVQLRWEVFAVLGITAILNILVLTKLSKRYQQAVDAKVNPWRWLDIAITRTIMLTALGLVAGLSDLVAFKVIALIVVTLAVLSWYQEAAPTKGRQLTSNLLKLALMLILLLPILGTTIYGQIWAPWYVYALYATLFLTGFSYSLIGRRHLQGQNFLKTERDYQVINLVSKLGFAVILITGLMS